MTKVAAIQLCSNDNVDENLYKVEKLIQEAVLNKAEYVLLPEHAAFLGKKSEDKLSIAEKFKKGPIQHFFSTLAKKYQIYLLGGTLPIYENKRNKVFNTLIFWDPEGTVIAKYDKMHLFDVEITDYRYQESEFTEPGLKPVVVDTTIGKMGLSICYDIRFPELYRTLLALGANFFVVPAAFTKETGKAHWEILLRARAIENLAFVIAANQTGQHPNGTVSFGNSMIIDPWGNILGQLKEEEGVIVKDLDFSYQTNLRNKFPVISHRII